MIIEILKSVLLGIIEGVTEWLPISSTGHMILVDEFLRLDVSDAFKELYLVVIQLGAIMAVVVLFWRKLLPLHLNKDKKITVDYGTVSVWLKIFAACVPAAVIGLIVNDWIDEVFYNYLTVSVTLIVYGILFIIIENKNKNVRPKIRSISQIDYKTALLIGVFQLLALIPGTSRSGATIIGAILIGTSRTVAAEFTFYLAIPVMFGASLLKILKFGFDYSGAEFAVLASGMATAFFVSIAAIRFLMGYIKRHDFKAFGWYRVILGAAILVYFTAKTFI